VISSLCIRNDDIDTVVGEGYICAVSHNNLLYVICEIHIHRILDMVTLKACRLSPNLILVLFQQKKAGEVFQEIYPHQKFGG